ncbi:MAG: Rrf2 family transcriptional regulator [Thauera sp.]|nr:Rrf2 family transcriptional regulator [Thauera sp.]
MQLTRFTDLGVRVLMYLSSPRAADAPLATVGEISEQFAVSHHHLVKVANILAQHGWIHAARGKGGGLRLAHAPSDIPFGAVVRLLEGDGDLIDCADPPCALRGGCNVKSVLDVARDAFFAALDRYTLADITAGGTGEKLARIQFHPPARAGSGAPAAAR